MFLEAKAVSFSYGKNSILDKVNLALASGERVGLMAPSGYGKTTLLELLSGYLKPAGGEILLDGLPLNTYRGYCPVQLIFQHPEKAINPRLKLKATLAEAGELAPSLLSNLGIRQAWLDAYPAELSAGELQRFAIARALSAKTSFLLADEITSMLDAVNQARIWRFLLSEIAARQLGLLAVSHSQALLEQICTKIINLEQK